MNGAPPIRPVHPPCPGGLLAGPAGQRALKLEEGAADLVADCDVALVVVDGHWGDGCVVGPTGTTAEDASLVGCCGGGYWGTAGAVEEAAVPAGGGAGC